MPIDEAKLVEWLVEKRIECGISLCSYDEYDEGRLAMIDGLVRRFKLTEQYNAALRKAKWKT